MKGKKIIVSALAASLVATPIATLGATGRVAFADGTTVEEKDYKVLGPELTIKRSDYPSSAQKGDTVTFKKPATGKVTVLDPFGNEVTTTTGEGDSLQFTPDIVGTYTYKFSAYGTNGDGNQDTIATTYELTLVVEGDSGSIEIPENSYFVIPSEFLVERKLTVPVPTCYVNDTLCNFETASSFEVETSKNATVKAYAKKGSDKVELKYVAGTSTTVASEKAHFETETPLAEGVWALTYELQYNNDVVATTSAKTIKVKKTLTNTKLYASYAKTPTKSAEAGVAYELVDLNVSMADNSTNYVEAFTQITVKYIKNDGESEDMVVDYDTMTFVPKYTGNYLVTYKAVIPSLGLESEELKYNIRNVTDSTKPTLYLTGGYYLDAETGRTYNKAFGYYDEDDKKYYQDDTKEVEVTGVVELTDMEMDEVYDEIENLSYNVKSYYQLGEDGKVKVAIPAGYVRDNYSTANNIKVTRALYVSNKTGEDDKLTLIATDETQNPKYNELAYFTFDKNTSYGVGSYIVRFVVQDEFNAETILDYAITIKDKNSITTETNNANKKNLPKVTFSYEEESVKADEKITFSAPTASDNYDVNVNTRVFYTLDSTIGSNQKIDASSVASLISQDKLTFLKNADKNDDGKYEIDLSKIETDSASHIYIGVISDNSYNTGIYELNKNLIVKEVKLIGTSADDMAPVIGSTFTWDTISDGIKNEANESAKEKSMTETGYLTNGKAMFDQNSIVTIPSFEFTDADRDMRFEIRISYMSNGEQVVLTALEQGYSHEVTENGGTYTHTISGAKFKVSYAKLYTVTVVAIDSNQNSTLVSFGVRVNDTEAPVISVVNSGKFDDTVEAGKEFTIPAPSIIDDGEIDEEGSWSWTLTHAGVTTDYSSSTRKFTPKEPGTYVITYKGKDANGNEAPNSEYRLNVTATALPTITLTKVLAATEPVEWDAEDDDQVVVIPKATAKDVYFDGALDVSVTVKNANGDSIDVSDESTTTLKFPVKTQGKYTVTYSVQGKYKSNTATYTINVGDVEAPTLNWKDKETDLKQTLEVGDTWTFKFNMIEVEDEKELDFASKINDALKDGLTASALDAIEDYCTITMTKGSSNIDYKIVDNGLQYTFDETGDYTFTIKLKDEAGNSSGTEYSYTITVNEAEQTTTTKSSNAVGTVLIVLSVVILAGVVSYFVITTKKVDKKAIENKGKKDKKDNK